MRFSGSEAVEKRHSAMIPAGCAVLAALLFHKIITSVSAPYNWTRIQRTFILAHGEKLYYSPDGPAVLAMYGPVSALVYWPAVWMHSLSSVMYTASFLNICVYLLPVLWICLVSNSGNGSGARYGFSAFLIFSFFAFIVSSLRDAAFNVHADAPALGFSALACAALYGAGSPRSQVRLALSAFFAVLAFWSKQVTAPLFLALPLYVGTRAGLRGFFQCLAWFAAFSLASGALLFKIFGFENLWFNLVTIPSRQLWNPPGGPTAVLSAVYKLCHESFFAFLFAAAVIIPLRKDLRHRPWSLFLWVSAFMLPAVVLSKLKAGSSNNVFCYVPYFSLLAAVLALADLNVRGRYGRFTNLMLIVFLLMQTPLAFYKFFVVPARPNDAQTAFDYVRKHPGRAYFPRLTVVHLLAEGRVYHESVALIDRKLAGLPVSDSQLRAFIPPHAALVAFPEASGDDRHWLDLPEFSVKTRDPELPGFVVYERPTG